MEHIRRPSYKLWLVNLNRFSKNVHSGSNSFDIFTLLVVNIRDKQEAIIAIYSILITYEVKAWGTPQDHLKGLEKLTRKQGFLIK